MPVLASKPPLPAAPAERKQEMQGGAESPRPVVTRRKPAHDRMSRAEVAAYSRKLVASLRDMDHMAPRPGDDAWRDPLPADLGPLSDDGEGAR